MQYSNDGFGLNWREMNLLELFEEMRLLLENLNLEKTIFRSNHASNHLALKGILGHDKSQLLAGVDSAIQLISIHIPPEEADLFRRIFEEKLML
ncbi:MAG: hypothetical protein FJX34_04660 [Alphaproteobacteria bacterium]|nr:hypothetical protein [Alphaproteobacteria bacterium]